MLRLYRDGGDAHRAVGDRELRLERAEREIGRRPARTDGGPDRLLGNLAAVEQQVLAEPFLELNVMALA